MKKRLLIMLPVVAVVAPLIVVSCGSSGWKYERGSGYDISYIKSGFGADKDAHKNVMSSYFNTTDMLAALGYYPDYASKSGDTLYSDYLKPILGSNNVVSDGKAETGKVTIKSAPKIMDGKVVDRETIKKSDISTLLLNEWEKVDESKYYDITPAIIYTSMADGHARFSDEQFSVQAINPWSLNVYEAFDMFAKGLDRAYPGHAFSKEAQKIITKVKANVTKLSQKIKAKTNQKTLLVLEVKKVGNDVTISKARSAGVYTLLYSKKDDRGLGYTFPTPNNIKNLKIGSFGVSAVDTATFKKEFTGKVDQIIVLINPQSPDKDELRNGANALVTSLLKDSSLANTNIHKLNRDEFYDSVWGIYGANKFLANFAQEFGIKDVGFNQIPELADGKTLTKLR